MNDALVRMLGYDSREELLQVDIATQLYLSPPAARPVPPRDGKERDCCATYEETLRRKDGSLIHTLQNAFAVRDSQGRIMQYRGLILDITEQKNLPSRVAAATRLQQQDPEQHAEHDPGGGYRRA